MNLSSILNEFPSVQRKRAILKLRKRFQTIYLPVIDTYRKMVTGISRNEGDRKMVIWQATVNPPIGMVFEAMFALKMREKGVDCSVVFNNGKLVRDDSLSIQENLRAEDMAGLATLFGESFASRDPYILVDRYIDTEDIERLSVQAAKMIISGNFMAEGVDLWPYIEASLVRWYKSAIGFWDIEPGHKQVLREYTENALRSVFIARKVHEDIHPEIIMTSHGIYSQWGPFSRYFRDRGIRTIVYDFGWYKDDGMVFTHSGLVANGSDDGFFAGRQAGFDQEKVNSYVTDFMKRRYSGDTRDLQNIQPSSTTEMSIEWVLSSAKGRQIFALFPNVLWDASNADTDIYFPNWIEWIFDSISYFMEARDKVLVIRAHPSEAEFMKSRVSVREIITRRFGKDPQELPNILFIPPEADFKSYDLFPHISAGMVYNGTLGLEMIYHHIPVFVAGRAPYQLHDFVHKFDDKADYFQRISTPDKVREQQEQHLDLLNKYLYTYFWGNQISVRYMKDFKHLPDPEVIERIWNDDKLSFVADTILGKHDFFQDWLLHEKII